jgi:hypothetical protein
MNRSVLLVAVLLALACGCDLKGKAKSAAPATAGGGAAAGASAQPLTPQEALAEQALQQLTRATDLMNSIRDRTSATAAAPELKAIAQKLQDLKRKGVPLGSQIYEKPEALGRFRAAMEKAVQRYADVAVRLLDQENILGPEFQAALHEFGKLPH